MAKNLIFTGLLIALMAITITYQGNNPLIQIGIFLATLLASVLWYTSSSWGKSAMRFFVSLLNANLS